MNVECFQVDSVLAAWEDGGNPRVGAMMLRNHQPAPYDADPRPFPHRGVMTPAGLICLDCPETDEPHGKWTVTGEMPKLTAHPSLDVSKNSPPSWHGWLVDGVLRD